MPLNNISFVPEANDVIFIIGPTASGKTKAAIDIAIKVEGKPCSGEIINADMAQLYNFAKIGTAMPTQDDFNKVPHHLFAIAGSQKPINASDYRKLVEKKITEIKSRNKIPVIVGGAGFYLKGLFFKLREESCDWNSGDVEHITWNDLNKIDPQRASEIHPNDNYRIKRAYAIWKATGVQPSKCKPKFDPVAHGGTVFLISPEKTTAAHNIKKRAREMFDLGFIDEVKNMSPEDLGFGIEKGFIGYEEISKWIDAGENKNKLPELTDEICLRTIQYFKQQNTFIKNLVKKIDESAPGNFDIKVKRPEEVQPDEPKII
ncbi:tRNA (adenosine(37)-N6)-dimethylallyltransferase MiaA [bacterium]|jgi:tRNA dimethylallyltransferase|nr:tRNA (adenosine(37)-N6)-dimethylallyltransferase MiaA [bacterium]